ncbi:MAG: VWA domain-containing protein [Muribaculaceae bacterium]|nr:VWA domain-containing protein [Muribaculaceae bacterium]
MKFLHPGLLWLLLIIIPLVVWYILKHKNDNPSLGISSLQPFLKFGNSWKVWIIHLCFALRMICIAAVIVALARPQTHDSLKNSRVLGTDIILALDISGSMSATDFKPNRFVAAKDVATSFVNSRSNDNMGLVVFAGESLSLMPLTNDRAALVNAIANIDMGDLNDGTAIGDGLTSAINRISQGKAKSKSIILLTDGSNNAGDVPPVTAAQIAKQKGIKLYTIGVGTNGKMQIADPYGFSTTTLETKIDEPLLKNMAKLTGGKYFRAKDERVLKQVFDEIDSLEKSSIDVNSVTLTEEQFMPWLWVAFASLALALFLRYTIIRRIP